LIAGRRRPLGVSQLALPPLSREATRQLLVGADADRVYERTGGNPFFIKAVEAAGGAEVSSTVRDAVLVRLARLAGDTWAAWCARTCVVATGRARAGRRGTGLATSATTSRCLSGRATSGAVGGGSPLGPLADLQCRPREARQGARVRVVP